MATSKKAKRIFEYQALSLSDPDPSMSLEEVKNHYASIYPDLNTAIIEEGEFNENEIKYKFLKSYGTKG